MGASAGAASAYPEDIPDISKRIEAKVRRGPSAQLQTSAPPPNTAEQLFGGPGAADAPQELKKDEAYDPFGAPGGSDPFGASGASDPFGAPEAKDPFGPPPAMHSTPAKASEVPKVQDSEVSAEYADHLFGGDKGNGQALFSSAPYEPSAPKDDAPSADGLFGPPSGAHDPFAPPKTEGVKDAPETFASSDGLFANESAKEDPFAPKDDPFAPKESDHYAPKDDLFASKESGPYAPKDDPFAPKESDPYAPKDDLFTPKGSDPFAPRENDPYAPKDDLFGPRDTDSTTQKDDLFGPKDNDPYAPKDDPFAPREDPFAPRENDPYAPKDDAFAPKEDLFSLRENESYAPKDDLFAPKEDVSAPPGDLFAPKENDAYAPKDDSFAAKDDVFPTKENDPYAPKDDPFAPGQNDPYAPKYDPFSRKENDPYAPKDDLFAPKEDPFAPRENDPYTPKDDPFAPREDPFAPQENDPYAPKDDPFAPKDIVSAPTDDLFTPSEGPKGSDTHNTADDFFAPKDDAPDAHKEPNDVFGAPADSNTPKDGAHDSYAPTEYDGADDLFGPSPSQSDPFGAKESEPDAPKDDAVASRDDFPADVSEPTDSLFAPATTSAPPKAAEPSEPTPPKDSYAPSGEQDRYAPSGEDDRYAPSTGESDRYAPSAGDADRYAPSEDAERYAPSAGDADRYAPQDETPSTSAPQGFDAAKLFDSEAQPENVDATGDSTTHDLFPEPTTHSILDPARHDERFALEGSPYSEEMAEAHPSTYLLGSPIAEDPEAESALDADSLHTARRTILALEAERRQLMDSVRRPPLTQANDAAARIAALDTAVAQAQEELVQAHKEQALLADEVTKLQAEAQRLRTRSSDTSLLAELETLRAENRALQAEIASGAHTRQDEELHEARAHIRKLEAELTKEAAQVHAAQRRVLELERDVPTSQGRRVVSNPVLPSGGRLHRRSATAAYVATPRLTPLAEQEPVAFTPRAPSDGPRRPTRFREEIPDEQRHRRRESLQMLRARMDEDAEASKSPAAPKLPSSTLSIVQGPSSTSAVQSDGTSAAKNKANQFSQDALLFCSSCKGDLIIV